MRIARLTFAILATLALDAGAVDVDRLTAEAASGSVVAQRELGQSYLDGAGVPRDVERGLALLNQAAEQKDPHAHAALADYFEALPPTFDARQQRLTHLRRASELGHTGAAEELAIVLLDQSRNARLSADDQARTRALALRLLEFSSRAGNTQATLTLGTLKLGNELGAPDVAGGWQLIAQAADAGHAGAAYKLARHHLESKPGDRAAGLRYLELAAERGTAAAQLDLAERSLTGNGVARDVAAAERYALAAQAQGADVSALLPRIAALAPRPAPPPRAVAAEPVAVPVSAPPITPVPARSAPSASAAATAPSVAATTPRAAPAAPKPAPAASTALAFDPAPAAAPAPEAKGPAFAARQGAASLEFADVDGFEARIARLERELKAASTENAALKKTLRDNERLISELRAERDTALVSAQRAEGALQALERALASYQNAREDRVARKDEEAPEQPKRRPYEPGPPIIPNRPEPVDEDEAADEDRKPDPAIDAANVNAQGLAAMREGRHADALPLFMKAANAGHADANNNLGMMYMRGVGTARDTARALVHLKRAAQGGNATAAANLGFIFAQGYGVPVNHERAIEWYERASSLGHRGSAEQVRVLSRYQRDSTVAHKG